MLPGPYQCDGSVIVLPVARSLPVWRHCDCVACCQVPTSVTALWLCCLLPGPYQCDGTVIVLPVARSLPVWRHCDFVLPVARSLPHSRAPAVPGGRWCGAHHGQQQQRWRWRWRWWWWWWCLQRGRKRVPEPGAYVLLWRWTPGLLPTPGTQVPPALAADTEKPLPWLVQ